MNCRILITFLWIVLGSTSFLSAQTPEEDEEATKLTVKLTHGGEMLLRIYEPDDLPPKCIYVFGSGDGGWSAWEHQISIWLRDEGVYVIGWDFLRYATDDGKEADFTKEELGQDMAIIAKAALDRCDKDDVPIIYGGWSSGAVLALPAAAWKDKPKSLAGIMLFGADSRGRYGLRAEDLVGKTPTGPGTFALTDFTKAVEKLRVVQFHGGADFMASPTWISNLKSPKALYVMPRANHGFDGPSPDFQEYLTRGVAWILGDESMAEPPQKPQLPFGLSPLWPISFIAVGLAVFFLLSSKHSLKLLELAMVVMGLVDLSEALWNKPPTVIAWMEQWVPLGITEKSSILLLVSGVSLLVLSRGIRRHKRTAWLLSLIMLSVTAVLHLSHAFDWHHALAAVILIIPLIRWRKEFIARSDASSLRLAWGLAVLLAFALFTYGTVTLYQFSQRGNFGEKLSWKECASGALDAVFLQKSRFDRDGGRPVRRFLETLRGGSLVTCLLALGLLLRPVLERRHAEATDKDRKRVQELINKYGRDPMDCFALLTDKRYCFGSDGDGVVAYALWRKFAVALADPICAPEARSTVIAEFMRFCKTQDWEPMFYCSHVANRTLYEEAGFITFKVGEDARLDVNEFKMQGKMFQNLRTARNKAQKAGLTFQWYDAKPKPDHGLEAQLQVISQKWLGDKHGGEMTFDLGQFNLDFIHEHGVSIVRDPEGRIENFGTWLPYKQGKGRCLDIMRGRGEIRDVMDFLLVEAIDHFKAEGVEEVSLGNAPLANADTESPPENRQERAVKFLFENFDQIYGYKRLFDFKKKYQPDWQGRYLAYRPRVSLAMIGLAIAGVHLPKGFFGLLRS
jgi:phosphatidylglycerol lysyltransferase